jgi:intracellular multiplication protein IcmB
VSIRNHIYKRLGPTEALRRLAVRYPGGSAKAEVERRRRLVADESGTDEEVTNVILEIVNEIARTA